MVVNARVACARVGFFRRARVQLTDGTVCNELLCDNYAGECGGKKVLMSLGLGCVHVCE